MDISLLPCSRNSARRETFGYIPFNTIAVPNCGLCKSKMEAAEWHHEATEIDRRVARYVYDNLADCLIPVNADVQDVDVILVPERDDFVNPVGVVNGIGELDNVGTAAAVANAVYHATGISVRQLPIRLEKLA
jgi:hypothetical protein